MRAVTAAFLDAITQPHQLATRVDLLRDGSVLQSLPVSTGAVTLDAQAATRGRLDATIIDADGTLVPNSSTSILAPYGNELRAYRGITYPDSTSELVSLGVFRIDAIDVSDAPEGLELRVSGLDRSARVIDARFTEAGQINAGTVVTAAISDLLAGAGITDTLEADTVAYTTPLTVLESGGDRWQTIQDLAAAAGLDVYFDGDGIPQARVITQPASITAAATIAEGAGGVLLTASRNWTRERAYNQVIATGERTGDEPPVRGVATDENPLSPTYYYGRFGRVPRFYASPLLTTNEQCAAAAASILAKELGTTQQVSFGAVVNPALEPGDTVQVTRERSGIDELHVIDQLTIPLAADQPMQARTRATQVTS